MDKIIEFAEVKKNKEYVMKKRAKEKEYLEAKETAKILIDNCIGDFAIVIKSEDINHVLREGQEASTEFIVAMSDAKRDNIDGDYFFRHFMDRTIFQL